MLALLSPLALGLKQCPPAACTFGSAADGGSGHCAGPAVLESKALFPMGTKNLWVRNAAPFPAEMIVVDENGAEEVRGVLAPAVLSLIHI